MTEKEELEALKRSIDGLQTWAESQAQTVADLKAAVSAILELVRGLNGSSPDQIKAFNEKYESLWVEQRKKTLPEFDKRRLMGQDAPKGFL